MRGPYTMRSGPANLLAFVAQPSCCSQGRSSEVDLGARPQCPENLGLATASIQPPTLLSASRATPLPSLPVLKCDIVARRADLRAKYHIYSSEDEGRKARDLFGG